MYVDCYVFEEEWYGKTMLGTLPHPSLPYPTLPYSNPNPTPNPPHPNPHPYPLHLSYPTPTPSPPNPYFTPVLPYTALPCPTIPYPTLPYHSAVYVGPFTRFGSSVVHFGIWVRFGPYVPFRFGPLSSKQSVQTGWTRPSLWIACQNYLNFTIVDLTNVEL